ncbi:NADPH-dependent diflavin oxidoreductase 1 [Dinochytrium kinnereticum]|nr:NADPH-dependent diflavin oxidoreductase 1 [Dinochytrium kinnereticum]
MRRLLVLYGSETGCAEDVAHRITREARRRHFIVEVTSMDDYDRKKLAFEELVVFVCSTTGQGEEPGNMKAFWKFLLRKSLPPDALSSLKFNFPAKKLYKRLLQLGGTALLPRGDGDDQHYLGLDGTLEPWISLLWSTVDLAFPLPTGLECTPDPSFILDFAPDLMPVPTQFKDVLQMTVVENTRITSKSHFQDIRLLRLRARSALSFSPADVAVIHAKNTREDVQEFIDHFQWRDIADKPFRLKQNRQGNVDVPFPRYLPEVLTIRTLLEEYLDVFGAPRRYFFEILSYFASDPLHADKLKEFSSAVGQEELFNYCLKPRRTCFEVLQDFTSVKIPVNYLMDCFQPIRSRSYSISNSLSVHPEEIDLVIGIVKYRTKLAVPRTGVCSKWRRSANAVIEGFLYVTALDINPSDLHRNGDRNRTDTKLTAAPYSN